MRGSVLAGVAGATAIVLAISAQQCLADAPAVAANAKEIAEALRGKICTTRVGAKFAFGLEGLYVYEGLWKQRGAYAIGDGAVTVTLDSGLERSFAISRHGSAYYIEQTQLNCRLIEPIES